MYLVNESSKHEPVKRVYKTREKSQSLLDHPRTPRKKWKHHFSGRAYISLHENGQESLLAKICHGSSNLDTAALTNMGKTVKMSFEGENSQEMGKWTRYL